MEETVFEIFSKNPQGAILPPSPVQIELTLPGPTFSVIRQARWGLLRGLVSKNQG